MVVRRLLLSILCGVLITPVVGACTQTANVDDAYMALDGDGNRKRNNFFTDTVQIFCVAEFASAREDVTLEMLVRQTARFDFGQNRLVAANRVLTALEIAPGTSDRGKQSLQIFQVDAQGQPDSRLPFPAGQYQCEINLDGVKQKTVPFNIAFPLCPDAEITNASVCLGFYELGNQCPEFGASSTENLKCTCTASAGPLSDTNLTGGNWVCNPPN